MTAFAAALLIAQAAAATQAPPTPKCEGAEHAAFDFWVGEWNVYQADGADGDEVTAHSRIEKLYGGCAIRENWMPLGQPARVTLAQIAMRAFG